MRLARIWHDLGGGSMGRRADKRSFGSIRRLPSGNHQVRYTAPNGLVVVAPTTFKARMDAEAWLLAERQRFEDPETWQPPKTRLARALQDAESNRLPTLESYAESWIETRRSSQGEPLRPLTRDKYRSALRNHVYPTFGDAPLDQITRTAVRAWYEALIAGPAAKAHAYTTLRTILNSATDEDELLQRNPARLRGAGARGGRRNLQSASLDELEVMVSAMPERLRLLLLLATWCSLRSGELRELRRGDIVIALDRTGTLTASANVSRGFVRPRDPTGASGLRTMPVVGAPKTAAGIRSVSILDFLVPVVEDHLARFAAPGPSGLLFSSIRDPTAHLASSTLNGRAAVLNAAGEVKLAGFGWREARRVAGRPDLDFHDLRHTGASWAGEEGASLAELMYRLGHSTPSTAIHYQHASLERDRELDRRLSARGTRQAQ